MINWKNIILHHSATVDSRTFSWDAIRRYHLMKNWIDIGYHFGVELVDDEIECIVGRPLTIQGAHTIGKNHDSIGICIVGNYDKIEPSPKIYETLVYRLIIPLTQIFDIPRHHIYKHSYFAKKTCPGTKFDMCKIYQLMDIGK